MGEDATLIIFHELCRDKNAWRLEPSIHVGVDSGQAGFYDEGEYSGIPPVNHVFESGRYSELCALTSAPQFAGVFDCGVVSSSGFGDGSYELHLIRDDEGLAVGARVTFIIGDDEELEEDEDEDED